MKNLLFTAIILIASFVNVSAQKAEPALSKVFDAYIELKNALVKDNAELATKKADGFIKSVSAVDYKLLSEGNINILKKQASEISESKSIDKQRKSFKHLSENMQTIAEKFAVSQSKIFVQHCPMAKASWLSKSEVIENPYYGSQMLNCGEVSKTIGK